jgi:hypothetical protein
MRVISLTYALMVLFSGLGAMAQSAPSNSDSAMARLSYQNQSVIDWRTQIGSPHICLTLYQSGYYQMSRLTEHGN